RWTCLRASPVGRASPWSVTNFSPRVSISRDTRRARVAPPSRRPMSRHYWLMKSEPFKYSFAQLVRDGATMWDGVRNFEARNNLRAMKVGDLSLFYHSNDGKVVVGVARIKREAYADPTAPGEDWSVVDVEPLVPFKVAVSLEAIRGEP